MKLFEDFKIKFEKPDWARNPELSLIDTIIEHHADIIVSGNRDVHFGHKVDLTSGRSKLVLHCDVLCGNPSDSKLVVPVLDSITESYGIVPRDCATDRSYASLANQLLAVRKDVVISVFNTIVGNLQNIARSKNLETMLKKIS